MRTLLCLSIFVAVATSMKRYDGYKVLEVVPRSQDQLKYLTNMMLTQHELDFWLDPTVIGRPVHIFVSPQELALVNLVLTKQSMPVTVVDENVQARIDADIALRQSKPENMDYDYSMYNTYDDYMTEMDALAEDCPADVTCEVSIIGQSSEGRDIKMLSIDTGAAENFWIDSCIHAREWLACATVMKLVDNMIRNSDPGTEANRILKSYNWFIVPIFNPDGYSFTFDEERMWRKSRNVNTGSSCIGTDLNRNHDHLWNTRGSSDNACSDTYHGRSPASTPEVTAIQDAGENVNAKVWLSFHTTGQYWLVPFGDCNDPENVVNVQRVADATCAAIEAYDNTNWDCGNSCRELYATGGTTADWAMGAAGVPYAYTPELRGPGFDPPPSAIQPSFEEIWDGLVAKVDEIAAIDAEPSNERVL